MDKQEITKRAASLLRRMDNGQEATMNTIAEAILLQSLATIAAAEPQREQGEICRAMGTPCALLGAQRSAPAPTVPTTPEMNECKERVGVLLEAMRIAAGTGVVSDTEVVRELRDHLQILLDNPASVTDATQAAAAAYMLLSM